MIDKLLARATTTVTGESRQFGPRPSATVEASVAGSGSVSATIIIEVSNTGDYWQTMDTISLSGTNSASSGFAIAARWEWIRARLTTISGASAQVNVTIVS